jgi:hypothetical protein
MTPGPQPGRRGFDSRRGYDCLWGRRLPRRFREPETAGSTPAGQMRSGGAAVPASLMSSRPWVRIPPALFADVAQTCRALGCPPRGRRFESGRPRRGDRGVTGASRGVSPAGAGSNPVGRPPCCPANAEHRRAPRPVKPPPRAVVVRLHPFALFVGDVAQRPSTSLAPRECGFDSCRLHSGPLWCQGQHAPFVRLKRRFDSCRRLFLHLWA